MQRIKKREEVATNKAEFAVGGVARSSGVSTTEGSGRGSMDTFTGRA